MKQKIHRLVDQYDLHRTVPVRLDPLEDLFAVRFASMEHLGLMGALLAPKQGWPVSPDNRGRILLDWGLNEQEVQTTVAHEIGHALYQHPGSRTSLSLGLEDKHERQAWKVASALLIPEHVVMEEQEAERVAMVCEVPLFMVDLWQSING